MAKKNEDLHHKKKALKKVAEELEKKIYQALNQKLLSSPIEWNNTLVKFMEEIEGIENFIEVNALIQEGKNLEKKLDASLAIRGETSMGIDWPILS
ncbi:MAG: hypothetical protein WCP39_04265 [Chlamydiota bacterium]